jgi:hypothetical protein
LSTHMISQLLPAAEPKEIESAFKKASVKTVSDMQSFRKEMKAGDEAKPCGPWESFMEPDKPML